MSVLVKDMKMPTSCYACDFFAQTAYCNEEDEMDTLSYCKRTRKKTWECVNGYLPNCPLVPVPPHGDLIDRDALRDNNCDVFEINGADGTILAMDVSIIDDAPTIIPAEEGELNDGLLE